MAIVSAFPNGVMNAADYCRSMFIMSGGDKITSGLRMAGYQNRTVQISAGTGIVDGVTFTNIQTEFFQSDLEPSNSPRYDRLVARKTIVPGTPTAAPYPQVELALLKGTPAPNPSLPALTQDHGGVWEFGLGYWMIAGNNVPAIPNGLVWGHYANVHYDNYADATVGNGTDPASVLVLAVDNDFRVPGSGTVDIDVLVGLSLGGSSQAGSVGVSALGQTKSVTFRHILDQRPVTRVPLTVPVRMQATVPPYGGIIAVIVEVATVANSSPVQVTHVSADLVEIMPQS